ncbi:MAG: EVE domain-containing protein [Saprospiraceae bacterium]
MNYWLVKSEPDEFSFDMLMQQGPSIWDGVRNYQARNNLRSMKMGDQVLFYHSREGLEIVGIATVVQEFFPDPTATTGDWSAVRLQALRLLPHPVSLAVIKADPALADLGLVRNPRLSVMPIPPPAFEHILSLSAKEG